MKGLILLFITLSVSLSAVAQLDFVASQDGPWTDGATWGNTSPGTVGVDFPGASDDVYTNGFSITVGTSVQCRDLFVEDVPNSLVFPGLIIVNGVMTGWSGGQFGFPTDLTSNVLSGTSNFRFTASDLSNQGDFNFFNNEVIGSWNNNSPITIARFLLSNSATIDAGFGGGAIRFTSQFIIISGSLSTGTQMDAIEVGGQMQLGNNASFTSQFPIYGISGTTSVVPTVTMNAGSNLTMASSNAFVNSNTFRMLDQSVFETNFSGGSQTQGWWNQSSSPTTIDLRAGSTVNYSANTNQNIAATAYSNLTLSQGGIKTLLNTGTLQVGGELSITNAAIDFVTSSNTNPIDVGGDIDNNGTWSPSQLVIFNGTAPQTINGNNPVTFGGGIRIENTTGVSLLNTGADINGEFDIDPDASFNPADQVVNMAGNMRIDGTLLAGTEPGGFVFDGTTSFLGSGTRLFHDFSIASGASLTAPLQDTLVVAGDFNNEGTFTANEGTIEMAGNASRTISGTVDFYNLRASGSTISNNATVNILHGLALGSSTTFDADGGGSGLLTITSTETNDAYVDIIPSGSSITGNVTVQRYFTTGRFWRYLGSPITNATVADWQEEFPITGTFSDPSSGTYDGVTLNSSNPSLYQYVENAGGGIDARWQAYPTSGSAASNPITNGRGYSPFIRNNTSNIVGAVTGTLKQGSATLPVSYSGITADDGWNLVANPYAAPIDWDAASGWTKTNVANEVHRPLTSGGFATYINGVGANGGTPYIASGQAFWVRTIGGSPSLQTTESVKSVDQNPTYFKSEPLKMLSIKMKKGDKSDEVLLVLRDEATFEYDSLFDANRRLNDPALFGYTLSIKAEDENLLKINGIPTTDKSFCTKEIPLQMENVSSNATGNYSLVFSNVADLSTSYSLYLKDNYTNTTKLIDSDETYSFTVDTEELSRSINRFSLILENQAPQQLAQIESQAICAVEDVSATIPLTEESIDYSIYIGDVLLTTFIGSGSDQTVTLPSNELISGENILEVFASIGECEPVQVGSFVVDKANGIAEEITYAATANCDFTASISIDAPQIGKTYLVKHGNNVIASKEVLDNTSQIELPVDLSSYSTTTLNVELFVADECGNEKLISDEIPLEHFGNLAVSGLNDVNVCAGETAFVQASGAPANGYYEWYDADNNMITSSENGEFTTEALSTDTSFFVKVITENGCESTLATWNVTVSDLKKPEIVQDNQTLMINGDYETYQWYLNNEIIEGATNSVHSVEEVGSYSVSVSNGNCSSESELYVIEVLSNVDKLLSELNIYPNPFDEIINIQLEGNVIKSDIQHISVFTLNGKMVYFGDFTEKKVEINTRNWKSGTYIIRLQTADGKYGSITVLKN